MTLSKTFWFLILLIFTCLARQEAYASPTLTKNKVNVISWWGYLDDPKINQLVEQQCGVEISTDTYYSNDEFLRRFRSNNNNYDIVIFSETIYDMIKSQLLHDNTDLSILSNKFNPTIREHYLKNHYPRNVIYFMLSLTGFLWNPNIIELTQSDTVNDLFKKAGNNIVVMLDDPIEIWNLINRESGQGNYVWDSQHNKYIPLNQYAFIKLIQKANVYLTNNYNQIYDQPNFAFSFSWSGDAIVYMKQAKKQYKFLIHPKLSYISSDLLATLNNNKATVCAAKALMSQKALDIVQNTTYYLSPYGDYTNVNDATYQHTYQDVIKNLSKLSWLKAVSAKHYQEMLDAWSQIQLNLHKQ